MMQFKTVVLPLSQLQVNKVEELYTVETGNKAMAPIARVIENEAKGGWHLHSLCIIPAHIDRKIGCLEAILGWIPVIGSIFRSKPIEADPYYYTLIFQREA